VAILNEIVSVNIMYINGEEWPAYIKLPRSLWVDATSLIARNISGVNM
jgi:hypothetical protein